MGGLFSNPKSKIIIVGLDNAGKTTLINKLNPDSYDDDEVAATVGYQEESFKKDKINIDYPNLLLKKLKIKKILYFFGRVVQW